MFKAIFYWTERGEMPVKNFIESLPEKIRQKIAAWIDLLEHEGPSLRRPYADKVKDKLYELRIRLGSDNIRVLYFFFLKDKAILLHGFRKKDWKIEANDLEIAHKRALDFISRYERGNIKF
ncbi:MAG: hypothetical protein A2036_03390 [Omnitrophica bacterium GWA2_50_21]|nr:MAG: hypothetical protein A2036_03390 [Omnitrophica bacterium GWA2_50_21]